jgi:hypothetical protein
MVFGKSISGWYDAGYWMLDAGYWILDTGYWMLYTGYWIKLLVVGSHPSPLRTYPTSNIHYHHFHFPGLIATIRL